MKKKINLSVEHENYMKRKWTTIVPPVPNPHIVKKELLAFIEQEILNWGGVPHDALKPLNFRLVIDGKAWNLPPFEFVSLYDQKFPDATNNIFRELERIIDLHEAFYED